MIIFPAIDIKEGKVVRLIQGRFNEVTQYSEDPVSVAKQWEERGAKWLHIVDLDGAQMGTPQNLEIILKIVQNVKIPVQVGGGIREQKTIDQLLSKGVARVILGTKAIENNSFLKDLISTYKDKIAVSLDCAQGFVQKKGWTESSELKGTVFAQQLEKWGLRCLIYTDISRDGVLQGPNFTGIEEILNQTNIPLIASGGIAKIEDIKQLLVMKPRAPMGVIIGKALYESKLNLQEAIKLCSRKE